MPDTMKIEILQDGTISITTDKISGTNHVSAEEFLRGVEKLSGGTRETQKRKSKFAHSHSHGVVHSH